MKYNDNGEWKDIIVKATDTLPIGTEVDYNGTDVPDGWEEVEDTIPSIIQNELDKKIDKETDKILMSVNQGTKLDLLPYFTDISSTDFYIGDNGTKDFEVVSNRCYILINAHIYKLGMILFQWHAGTGILKVVPICGDPGVTIEHVSGNVLRFTTTAQGRCRLMCTPYYT